jgi:hypothetical protein
MGPFVKVGWWDLSVRSVGGTLSWDPPMGPVIRSIRQLMGPTCQVDQLVGPARGTRYQGRLVEPTCQVSWWDLAIGLKISNLNSHIDMARR